jgi:hypothetical protein
MKRKMDAVRQVTVTKKRSDPISSTSPNTEITKDFSLDIDEEGMFSLNKYKLIQ